MAWGVAGERRPGLERDRSSRGGEVQGKWRNRELARER
jgi:hypothetical protein